MVITQPAPRPLHWSVLLATAILVTLFLYFIDEGRYSLEELLTTGNLIAMSVYLIGLVGGLFLMARVFASRPAGAGRTALVLGLGTIVGFLFGLVLIFGMGALMMLG